MKEGIIMAETEFKHVAVIGAGLMGAGVAAEFARFGCETAMYNTRRETSQRAMQQAKEALDLMAETDLISKKEAEAAFKRLHPTIKMEEAVQGAQFVHESVLELLSLKKEVFARLDGLCDPSVILATNTSGFRVTDIASNTKHPERVVATHYFQPPQFVPLVEVVPGKDTSPQTVEKTAAFMRRLRKRVAVIKVEMPGFIGNRIQGVIGREIQELVDRGVGTPELIDDVIQFGFGRRMAYTGYFRRLDLIGLDFIYNSAKGRGGQPWKPIAEHVERGELGMETGKGFYDWPGDSAAKFQRQTNMELIRLMKFDMERGDI
jgi:3-hydroxybutyryl-CoA dehydrogenase